MSTPWHELPEVGVEWRGLWPYAQALAWQQTRRQEVLEGRQAEVLCMQEHDPVLTLGRRRSTGVPGAAFWAERGIDVVQTERGGLATLHNPGQVVGSLILDLGSRGLGVRRAVCAIEAGLITWLGQHGIEATRRPGSPGVWVGESKIGSIGLHIRRNVTMHGFALNLCNDLGPFDWFDACGIADVGVTSVENLTGQKLSAKEVTFELGNAVLWSLFESSVDREVGGR